MFYFVLSYGLSMVSSALMYIMPGYLDKMESFEISASKADSVKEVVSTVCQTANFIMLYTMIIIFIMIGVCFFITNYMLSKKLELE